MTPTIIGSEELFRSKSRNWLTMPEYVSNTINHLNMIIIIIVRVLT